MLMLCNIITCCYGVLLICLKKPVYIYGDFVLLNISVTL